VGRQHSSRIVRCGASTAPFVCGRPADAGVAGGEIGKRLPEAVGAVLATVVGQHALEPPARLLQLARDPLRQL
jgi:hypothetical protein